MDRKQEFITLKITLSSSLFIRVRTSKFDRINLIDILKEISHTEMIAIHGFQFLFLKLAPASFAQANVFCLSRRFFVSGLAPAQIISRVSSSLHGNMNIVSEGCRQGRPFDVFHFNLLLGILLKEQVESIE